VSPTGTSTGDGSPSRPLDLATALSAAGPVKPGDTVWLHGGVYRGTFHSTLSGTASAPIHVRQYPGERATIDGYSVLRADILRVDGAWTVYEGFEVTNTYPQRVISSVGSNPPDRRGIGVNVFGPNNKFRDLVVHDAGDGFGVWRSAVNVELSGNVVYNNGWEAPDRGHGHGIYVQNDNVGVHRLLDNIVFNNFSNGIHAYGSHVKGIHAEGNTLFNNGWPSRATGLRRNILLGGGTMAENSALVSNFTYMASLTEGENNVGYDAGCSNVRVVGNYFARGYHPMLVFNCTALDVQQNTFVFSNAVEPGFEARYPGNAVSYSGRPPSGVQSFVRRHQATAAAARAHVVVYNWSGATQAVVDVAPAQLVVGQAYVLRDAQNVFAPILTFTYGGGGLTIPLTGRTMAAPVGNVPVMPQHTAPTFNVFVLHRSDAVPAPTPAAPTQVRLRHE
jgi:hypothetical protein